VRAAIERAWFEQQPLRVTYVDGNFIETTRNVRIQAVLMDRHETRIDVVDLDDGERRRMRLDRIAVAEVLRSTG
jgi:predicted DNA-binding transcriptional regulator YafY